MGGQGSGRRPDNPLPDLRPQQPVGDEIYMPNYSGVKKAALRTDPADIESNWAESGNDIYNSNSGNVGIGNTNPSTLLELNQSADDSGIRINAFDDVSSRYGEIAMDSSGYLDIKATQVIDFKPENAHVMRMTNAYVRLYDEKTLSFGNGNDFSIGYSNGEDYLQFIDGANLGTNVRMVIDSDGKVGINKTDPADTLTIVPTAAGLGLTIRDPPDEYDAISMNAWGGEGTMNIKNAGVTKILLDTGNSYFNISGNFGIGTTTPSQILDCNSGGGNMIADGYDTHSLAVYKENIEDASGYLDKVLACPAQKWNRKPFISADEIKEAVLKEFGEDVLIEEAVEAKEAVLDEDGNELESAVEAKDSVYEKQYSVWDKLFPEENSHKNKALYNMPESDLKTWIDNWCEAKRVEMRPENKWQKKRLGLVADAELTAEHLPEVIAINDTGEPTGIDTMTYIGILHNAIQELSAKVEALENA